MITYIDIITGFLEGGKTTFIRELIKKKQFREYKNPILIICEEGNISYNPDELKQLHINTVIVSDQEELNHTLFKRIEQEYNPDYILVEYNGTWDISKILGLKMPFHFSIRTVMYVANANVFISQLLNMTQMIHPHILNSNILLVNRYDSLNKIERKKLSYDIKKVNSKTKVCYEGEYKSNKIWNRFFIPFIKPEIFNVELTLIILLIFSLFLFPVMFHQDVYQVIQAIVTVALSIIMQAIPFLLLGALISSFIQIALSPGLLVKYLSNDKFGTFIIAAMAGIFMPVCDCGMVPVVSGMLKKKIPLPQTMTFWLASSAVNPIVLLSVYYAFPEKPYMVLFRMLGGVTIALMVGFVFKIFRIESKEVLKDNGRFMSLNSELIESNRYDMLGRVKALIQATKIEFFRMMEYVIIGAFLSAFIQKFLPQFLGNYMNQNIFLQLLIMFLAAIFMSTCSTSNAFIGKSFSNQFLTIPVLAFMTMGPMLDIKNIIMLSGTLKKRFLVFLTIWIIISGLLVMKMISLII